MSDRLAEKKIVITGAAGLVGQNLMIRLKDRGYTNLVGIDKHPANTAILSRLHPGGEVISADLARAGPWEQALQGADTLIILHAQIGGLKYDEFESNNIVATRNLMAAAEHAGISYTVHVSSSVINSQAVDFYTETKKAQEQIVEQSAIPHCILRPTLMFGWFDRKHLGWLSRFMQRAPVFPIPGSGRYLRQPLYALDFCDIIIACLERRISGATYDISGQLKIDYIDLIRALKAAVGCRTPIVRIPYSLFWGLLKLYALMDRNPPFTTQQLEALVTPDEFEIIDWPGVFGVQPTPLIEAFEATFNHPEYSRIVLEF